MAWSAPQTWVTGTVVTAADMNREIRDNLLETSVAKSTAAGDITYATALNALARLGIGSAGQRLTVSTAGTAPVWKSPPSCRVFSTGDQSISTGGTALTFSSEAWDTDGMHSTSSQSSRITINTPGRYLIGANAEWGSDTAGWRRLSLLVNDTGEVGADQRGMSGNPSGTQIAETIWAFSSGEWFSVKAQQNVGGTKDISGSSNRSLNAWACWLGST